MDVPLPRLPVVQQRPPAGAQHLRMGSDRATPASLHAHARPCTLERTPPLKRAWQGGASPPTFPTLMSGCNASASPSNVLSSS